MNRHMTLAEFEALPYRDDIKGDYIEGQFYRAKAWPKTVFQWKGGLPGNSPLWWAFSVTLKE